MKKDNLKAIFGEGLVKKYEDKIGTVVPLTADQRKVALAELTKAAQTPEFWDNPCVDTELKDAGKQKIMLLRAPNKVQENAKEWSSGTLMNLLFTGIAGDQWIGAIFPAGTEKLIAEEEVYFVCGRYTEKPGEKGTFHNLSVTAVFQEDDLKPAGAGNLGNFE